MFKLTKLITAAEGADRSKLETALKAVTPHDDHHAIRSAIDALNQATMHLAELMMDTAVTTALKGKTMDGTDFDESSEAGHPMAKAEFK